MFKKTIALMSIMTIALSLTACKSNNIVKKEETTETKIEVSEIKPITPGVSTNQQKVENAKKKTEISNTVLNMFSGGKDAFVKIVTNNGGTIEDSANGIYVLTEKVSQREAIINELDNASKKIANTFQKKGTNFTINYSVKYGYVDVYCSKNEANSLQDEITPIIANVACGQRLSDNTMPWGVVVSINDVNTSKCIKQFAVSEDEKFDFNASDWTTTNIPTTPIDTSSSIDESEVESKIESEEETNSTSTSDTQNSNN